MRYTVFHKCQDVVEEKNGAPRNLLQVVMRSTPYDPQCAAETLEYIRSACKISTLSPPASLSARPSSSLPSRPRFTYILSLYFYDASGGFPPSLPISLSLSLHLVSLSSRGKGGGGLCQPFCALHDMKRADGRTDDACHLRRALTLSVRFVLAAQKEGRTNDGRTASVSNGSSQSA